MTTPPDAPQGGGPPEGGFSPPYRAVPPRPGAPVPPATGGSPARPAGVPWPSPQPGPPDGYYPEQPYYAPGWQPAGTEGRPSRRRRRNVVVTVVMIAALLGVSVLGAAVAGLRYVMDTRPLGEVDAPVTAAARRLDVGHCIEDLPPDGDVSRVRVVPCGAPHEAEVVGALALNEDGWPGRGVVERAALAYCEMDRTQAEAGFQAVVWQPSQTGWSQGDTHVLCLAWSGGDQVTGSFTAGDQVARG